MTNLFFLTSLILTRQSFFGLLNFMLLSFSQAFNDLGRQVPNRSLVEWIDKIDNVFILFSAKIHRVKDLNIDYRSYRYQNFH